MIYSTNRTASLGDTTIEVDVNESYFGAGSLVFMQEAAEDELALFENAIKSDIDEFLIGESAEELNALNEGFAQTAVNKIKELMRKFMEWLKAVTRSALARLSQFVQRDNASFCKTARKRLTTMKNVDNFKYTGKALKDAGTLDYSPQFDAIKEFEKLLNDAKAAKTLESAESIKKKVDEKAKEVKDIKLEDILDKYIYDEENGSFALVEKHLKFLESTSKEKVKDINKKCKELMSKASKISKDAEKAAKDIKDDEQAAEKNRLNTLAYIAGVIKTVGQMSISNDMKVTQKCIKVARAVVSKAMGATPKNESGIEYTEELVQAMIEADEYELDEAFEEMSESKCEKCDDDDDISDDDDEK